ncbi:MAG: hypothetical protein PUP92_11350 [Rhizonema sp. PD38]|nr:hypothetical protein [Rhizonema sp. PD38]
MIDFIKNLISGIVNFFSGLFRSTKEGYYMVLDEAADAIPLEQAKQAVSDAKQAVETAASDAKKAVETAASDAKKAVETVTSDTQKAAGTVATNTQKVAETATSNTKKVAKTAASNTQKAAEKVASKVPAASNGKKTSSAKAEPQVDIELVQTAEGVKAQPAETGKSAAKVLQEPVKDTTFAPKHLAPTNTNGRRRPGANMSSFLDMARQVKTPG